MLLVILYCVLCIIPLCIGAAILSPLDRAARFRRDPIRYHMVDFLGLMFLLTASMAAVRLGFDLTTQDDSELLVFGCVGLAIVAGIVWASGVTAFSRAGIHEWKDRATLVFFVLPAAFAGTVAIYGVGFSLLLLIGSNRSNAYAPAWILLLVSLFALQCGAVTVARRIAKRYSRGIRRLS